MGLATDGGRGYKFNFRRRPSLSISPFSRGVASLLLHAAGSNEAASNITRMPSRGCLARRGAGKSATTKETFQSKLEEKETLPRGVGSSLFRRQRKTNQSEFFKKWLSNERIFLRATYNVSCWAFEIGRSGLSIVLGGNYAGEGGDRGRRPTVWGRGRTWGENKSLNPSPKSWPRSEATDPRLFRRPMPLPRNPPPFLPSPRPLHSSRHRDFDTFPPASSSPLWDERGGKEKRSQIAEH